MSDNFSLIVKNGSCYINGKLTKIDIERSQKAAKKITEDQGKRHSIVLAEGQGFNNLIVSTSFQKFVKSLILVSILFVLLICKNKSKIENIDYSEFNLLTLLYVSYFPFA